MHDAGNNMDDSQTHYVKWQKVGTKGYFLNEFIYMTFWCRASSWFPGIMCEAAWGTLEWRNPSVSCSLWGHRNLYMWESIKGNEHWTSITDTSRKNCRLQSWEGGDLACQYYFPCPAAQPMKNCHHPEHSLSSNRLSFKQPAHNLLSLSKIMLLSLAHWTCLWILL